MSIPPDYQRDFDAMTRSGPVLLDEDKRRKNLALCRALKDILPIKDIYKVNDCDLLYRFLIARHWNLEQAQDYVRRYAKRRQSENLDGLLLEDVNEEIAAVISLIYGFDKDGLPVLWMFVDPGRLLSCMKRYGMESLIRAQTRTMEQARFLSRARGVDRCTYVIDLGKVTMSAVNSTTLGFVRELTTMLQQYYPEVMWRMLVYNTGWAVSGAWKVLKPFVDARVQDKIRFFNCAPTVASLAEFVTSNNVLPSLGGTGKTDLVAQLLEAEIARLRRHGPTVTPPRTESFEPLDASAHQQAADAASHDVGTEDARMLDEEGTPLDAGVMRSPAQPSFDHSSASDSDDYFVPCRSPTSTVHTASRDNCSYYFYQDSSTRRHRAGEDSDGEAGGSDRHADLHTLYSRDPSAVVGQAGEAPALVADDEALAQTRIDTTVSLAGSVTGYADGRFVGEVTNSIVYGAAEEVGNDSIFALQSPLDLVSPLSPSGPLRGARFVMGQFLRESGHPVHHYLIVCDARHCARFLLRRSRLRKRLTIFQVLGDIRVRTDNKQRHYIEEKKVPFGFVLPHPSGSEGWVAYGEDLVVESKRRQRFWRRLAPARWVERGIGTVTEAVEEELLGPSEQEATMIAECRGLSTWFYGTLSERSITDLFMLSCAISALWFDSGRRDSN